MELMTPWDYKVFEYKKPVYQGRKRKADSSSSIRQRIHFEFHCETQKKWVRQGDDGQLQCYRIEIEPEIKTCLMAFDYTVPDEYIQRSLQQHLEDYNLQDDHQSLAGFTNGLVRLGRIVCNINGGKMESELNVKITKYVYIEEDERYILDVISDDDHAEQMVPASEDAILSLPMKEMEYKNGCGTGVEFESCMVCLEEMPTGVEISTMPCCHVFHVDCIREWLKKSHYCPVCRYEMPIASN